MTIANREKIASVGGIEAIMVAMSAHKDQSGVQEQACTALWNVSANSDGMVSVDYVIVCNLCHF